MLTRLVTKEYPVDSSGTDGSPKPFSSYLDIPNLILLGDPGAGKSFLFKEASEYEQGLFYTARNFVIYAEQTCSGKVLYVDALDEKRSRTDSPQSIDELVKLIIKFKPSKFRLSCRAADWLGETDLEVFRPYFDANGGYCVVALEALTAEEIDYILHQNGIDEPTSFCKEAKSRGVSFLLKNPQTLIMLVEAVQDGVWPATKKELYQKSTGILLAEHNKTHTYENLGALSANTLFDAAGASCASALISDVAGISLLKNTNDAELPSYSSIPYDSTAVLGALTRRAFISVGNESVTYTHRTIAEYLGACWLAKSVRAGIPIGRLRSLIGIEGHPAPELRGLHAWLATVLPEHAATLINADPYGVLAYGDVASLSPGDRRTLLNELVNLSEKDPSFSSQEIGNERLGALSGSDMVEAFSNVLSLNPEQFHLRTIVLKAIRYGQPVPELLGDLLKILCNENAPYSERANAFHAIIQSVPDSESIVVDAVKERLNGKGSSVRLRALIMSCIYADNFGPKDVVCIIEDLISDDAKHTTGELWLLPENIPHSDLPEILDLLSDIKFGENVDIYSNIEYEVEYCNSKFLSRILQGLEEINPARLWKWLSVLNKLRRRTSRTTEKDEIRTFLVENNNLVFELLKVALSNSNINDRSWSFWTYFSAVVMQAIDQKKLAREAFSMIMDKATCEKKDKFIFELIVSIIVNLEPSDTEFFEILFNYGKKQTDLSEILEHECFCEVQDWRWENNEQAIKHKNERENGRKRNRTEFENNIDIIRNGHHFGWLEWIAKVYFAKFADIDDEASPDERLKEELGNENTMIAIEGLRSLILKGELPTPADVGKLNSKNKHYSWWYAIVAGMDECWRVQPDIHAYPIPVIKSSLAIDLVHPTYSRVGNTSRQIIRGWKEELYLYHPMLVQSVYIEMIRIALDAKNEHISGLYELCEDNRLLVNRGKNILDLLCDYPNAKPRNLERLLFAVISDSTVKESLLNLAQSVLNSRSRVRGEQRALWLSVIFLLSYDSFGDVAKRYVKKNQSAIWVIKSIVENARIISDRVKPFKLSTEQLAYLINLVGKKYDNVNHPEDGWSGNQNPWDAAEFVRKLVNDISTRVDANATKYLKKFSNDTSLSTYSDHIKHALANQEALRRQYEFLQPNWDATIEALRGGKPAHISDLHALTVVHLRDLIQKIRYGNTDIYKKFWNENRYNAIESPKGEESCRDVLIDLLKSGLVPIDVIIEPEGHMAIDKRADIVLLLPGQKLPIELKRDYHKDLWTACRNQLDRLYARDPNASGYGLYVVFWFGDHRPRNIPRSPSHIKDPKTPEELEFSLRSLIHPDNKHRLEVIVIDVTKPDE